MKGEIVGFVKNEAHLSQSLLNSHYCIKLERKRTF